MDFNKKYIYKFDCDGIVDNIEDTLYLIFSFEFAPFANSSCLTYGGFWIIRSNFSLNVKSKKLPLGEFF